MSNMILSAGVVPVRQKSGDYEFLLLRCFKYWDFPKGETEENENPLKTALRELSEETSLTEASLNWGEDFYETEVYSKGKIARYYLGEITDNKTVTLLPNPENGMIEHHEYRWVSYAEGQRLANPRIKKVLDWAYNKLTSRE